jgi:hypothetical protein
VIPIAAIASGRGSGRFACFSRSSAAIIGGAAELSEIGRSNPNPAHFRNRLHTFVARGCERLGDVRNKGNEETAGELVSRADVIRLVRDGRIDHVLVLAGLYYLELSERRP